MQSNDATVQGRQVTVAAGTGGAAVTIVSPYPEVISWVTRYFSPWWPVTHGGGAPAVVFAREEAARYDTLAASVAAVECEEAAYPRHRTRYVRHADGTVIAASPDDRIAYRYTPVSRRMSIYGKNSLVEPMARAAARIAREVIRAQLITDGWALLHASAVTWTDERAVLTLGNRGAGKSTVAFTLAAAGAGLLANDRVFARPTAATGVELLPWPSGAAVGLGLMEALGWTGIARARLVGGARPHTSQDQRVTDGLLAGHATGMWGNGQELKAHIRPEEFTSWYGLLTARSGRVATVLFPQMRTGAEPGTIEGPAPAVGAAHFMTGEQEDSYPDIFGLTGGLGAGSERARTGLAARLGTLPCHAILLGHDHQANARFLSRIVR